jgi:hypothetical protein
MQMLGELDHPTYMAYEVDDSCSISDIDVDANDETDTYTETPRYSYPPSSNDCDSDSECSEDNDDSLSSSSEDDYIRVFVGDVEVDNVHEGKMDLYVVDLADGCKAYKVASIGMEGANEYVTSLCSHLALIQQDPTNLYRINLDLSDLQHLSTLMGQIERSHLLLTVDEHH